MASTDPNPTTTDPVAPTPEPISITVTDPEGGTFVWTPGSHGQKHLHEVSEEELPGVLAQVEDSLKDLLQGLTGAICVVVHPEIKEEAAETLLALAVLGSLFGDGDSPRFGGFGDPFGDVFGLPRFGGGI